MSSWEFATPYANWLLRQTKVGVDADREALFTTLKRRGFLISQKGGEILVSKGSHEDDIETLKSLGRDCGFYIRAIESDLYSHEIYPAGLSPDFAERILMLPSARGMTAVHGSRYGAGNPWALFKKYKYGAKVPTRELDLGIALFIKALPLAGIRTYLCCDGHGQRPPKFSLTDKHQIEWFFEVRDHINAKRAKLAGLQFQAAGDYGDLWFSVRSGKQLNFSQEEMIETCDLLFEFASYLMDVNVIAELRARKTEHINFIERKRSAA